MAAFGIKAIQPQDNEHIFGFATARGTADDSLLEVWNGPTNADLVYTLDKEGQHQSASGSAARPTYSFEADKDTGRYLSGAASMLDVVSGTAVGTWTAGKLTLVQLQVDNLNLNGNTLSSTAGTDLLITPLSGQQIVLDGAIVIDAGVVTGATSITSTNFVGTLTGASTATLVTVVDSTDTTSSIAMFDSATGTLAAKTDAGLTYNAGTGVLTATGFTGPLTGLASTSTLASTVVVVDSTDTSSFIAMFDSATGSLAAKTDAGLTYNAGTGMLTATGLTGPLTGLASTASVATLANTVVVVDSSDTTSFPAFFDSATGSLAIKTDASNLTYNAGTGILTAAGFAGPLVGDVTGDLAGDVTGNSDTATLASTVTVAASGGDTTSHIAMFDSASGSLAAKTDPGITYNATSNVLTAAGFAGPITGAVTGNADTATLASTVTVAASGGDTSSHIAMFNSATGSLAVLTDPGITYNAGTNVLTSTFAGNITGNVTGDVTGDLQGDVTGNSDTATVSSTVVVVDSTDASSFIAMFDSATGSLAAKTDAGLTYNASTGMLTATGFTGSVALATLATTVTITDNESTDEDNAIIFTAGGDVDGGNLGLESDGTLTYNPSDGLVTATAFAGALTGNVTGNVTGNCSGSALTVTQAAQTAITSVGTLTSLAVGDITSTGDLVVNGVGPHTIGGANIGYVQMHFTGAFTSSGASTTATGILGNQVITGASGDTASICAMRLASSTVTQTATESIGYISQLCVEEPAITDNLTGDITVASTVYIKNAPTEGESNYALLVDAGAVQFDGTLGVTGTTTVQRESTGVSVNASSVLNLEGNAAVYASFISNGASEQGILWSDSGSSAAAQLVYNHGSGTMGFTAETLFSFNKSVYINDSANAKSTLGLTINQGANDNEILALKSSDVAHPMTGEAEADTYGFMQKHNGTAGGLQISGLKDADSSAEGALALTGFLGEAADTTKSASAGGVINMTSVITNGSTGATVVGTDGNLVVIHNGGSARFIFDAEGSGHADVEWTTF